MEGKATVININMDKKCVQCGETGALESGYCMGCATKLITDQMAVGPQALSAIQHQIGVLFRECQRKIDRTIKANGELSINFKVELKIFANSQVGVQTAIDFTAEKIKDKSEIAMVSEIQGGLFET
jgi:hypothetical protein